jgi:hypothetical protein
MSTEVNKRPRNTEEIYKKLAAIEYQLTGNSPIAVNIGSGDKTAIVSPTTTNSSIITPQQQPEKLPLLAWFAALIVSLLILWWIALGFKNNKFTALPPDYGQAPVKKGDGRI